MRKAETVDEYAETEVLIRADDVADRDADVLSLYSEYESQLAHDASPRRELRARR